MFCWVKGKIMMLFQINTGTIKENGYESAYAEEKS